MLAVYENNSLFLEDFSRFSLKSWRFTLPSLLENETKLCKMKKNRKQLEERAAWMLVIIVVVIAFVGVNLVWYGEGLTKLCGLLVIGYGGYVINRIIERLNRR